MTTGRRSAAWWPSGRWRGTGACSSRASSSTRNLADGQCSADSSAMTTVVCSAGVRAGLGDGEIDEHVGEGDVADRYRVDQPTHVGRIERFQVRGRELVHGALRVARALDELMPGHERGGEGDGVGRADVED